MSVRASIVVPTYRRNDLLRRCLEQLASQEFDAGQYEVIVADDACDAVTEQVIREFRHNSACSISYVAVGPPHGPAAARNAGWRAAQGRFIAFTDDDCLPDRFWLREGVAVLERTDAAAAAGTVVVPLPSDPTDYERDAAGLSRGEFVTANCFCRRDVLEAIGGFDERFRVAWREDSDLQFTLLEGGYTIVRADEAIVIHPVRPAPWGVSLKQQKKTAFNALLYKKHEQLYRQRVAPTPLSYYATTASIAGTVAGVVSGMFPLAAASAACWAALTARFCRRRLTGASRRPGHIVEMAVTSALIPPLSLFWHVRGMLSQRVWFR